MHISTIEKELAKISSSDGFEFIDDLQVILPQTTAIKRNERIAKELVFWATKFELKTY